MVNCSKVNLNEIKLTNDLFHLLPRPKLKYWRIKFWWQSAICRFHQYFLLPKLPAIQYMICHLCFDYRSWYCQCYIILYIACYPIPKLKLEYTIHLTHTLCQTYYCHNGSGFHMVLDCLYALLLLLDSIPKPKP